MTQTYAPIPRKAAERLKALLDMRDRADAEARGLMAGLAWGLGIDPDSVTGVDDGEMPALLLRDEDSDLVE